MKHTWYIFFIPISLFSLGSVSKFYFSWLCFIKLLNLLEKDKAELSIKKERFRYYFWFHIWFFRVMVFSFSFSPFFGCFIHWNFSYCFPLSTIIALRLYLVLVFAWKESSTLDCASIFFIATTTWLIYISRFLLATFHSYWNFEV